ncbi:MAG: heme-degrading domain-containing protein [Candidatus Devosia euplotis]|nr:heme-degrading domain-containing protein [Candidatus Devosia euplotis]
MTVAEAIALVKKQEETLVLGALDEDVAFALGSAIRARAFQKAMGIAIDIRTWDRQMFFAATAGTSADNAEWVRRKINAVRRFQRARYRMVLERGEAPFPPQSGAGPTDYVIAGGGGFPIRVRGAGIIGCLTISGLPGWSDQGVAVSALAAHLRLDPNDFALPPEQVLS